MKLSHALGQVLLKDKNYRAKILAALEIDGEDVIEVGSGPGDITDVLLPKVAHLSCVEYDARFVAVLKKRFAENKKVTVVKSDILKFSLEHVQRPVVVFGNIPYQISNRLIHYLICNRAVIKRAYLTVQKEFASKLVAIAGQKAYGSLSCYAQYYASVRKVFAVPARAFVPVPKVDSSFVMLDFVATPRWQKCDEEFLFRMIRQAFSARRKKVINSLSVLKEYPHLLDAAEICADARPETISLTAFVKLACELSALGRQCL